MTRGQAFSKFLHYFPEVDLPQTIAEENLRYYSSENHVLPPDLIRQFLHSTMSSEEEDYLEFIPCFKLKNTQDWHAIVYWKAALLSYEFVLSTYNKNGIRLAQKVIAGMRSDGKSVIRSIATIDEEWIINIVIGEQASAEDLYDTANSRILGFELMADGSIISHQNEL